MSTLFSNKSLIGYIYSIDEIFIYTIVDSMTKKVVAEASDEVKNLHDFISGVPVPPENVGSFKAVIINLYDIQATLIPAKTLMEYLRTLKEKLNNLNIASYFITPENFAVSSYLIENNVAVNFNETVVLVIDCKTKLGIVGYEYKPNGYQQIHEKYVELDFKSKPSILRNQILGTLNPKTIVFPSSACKKQMQPNKVFKGLNFKIFDGFINKIKYIIENGKWVFDKSSTKYHIVPTVIMDFQIYGYFGSDNHVLDIFNFKTGESLPITKTAKLSKSIPEIHTSFEFMNETTTTVEKLQKECHIVELTVTIDEDQFSNFKYDYVTYADELNFLCSTFNGLLEPKFPVIGFFDNSSVIALHKIDQGGYKFLDEWNGVYGNDLFISFDQEKLQFGQPAMEALKTGNTFVVFDLLKIMSMPVNAIKVEKHWGFWFTKNDENPVLLEFDTFAEGKKAASPSFLMALLLRQHLKVIKKLENGKNPTKIGLFVVQKFTVEEMNRIKEGLGKACELLEVEYTFIETQRFM